MGAAVAVILMKERRVFDAFLRAGATSAAAARSPTELGIDPDGVGWRRLRERAIVREASPDTGLYYLDVEVWRATRRTRLRVIAVLIVILMAVLALMAGGYVGSSNS